MRSLVKMFEVVAGSDRGFDAAGRSARKTAKTVDGERQA
jgi:hypothetical protein